MKEQTPIKRHAAMISLSKDHHFGLLLVWKIRQGLAKKIETERISNYVLYFFEMDLEQHFKEEEELLFPCLPVDDPLRLKAVDQHQAINKLIAAIRANKNDGSLLIQMADQLESHIRFEERELFNHIQSTLSEIELEKLAEKLSTDSKSMDDKWEDAFWNTDKRVHSL